MNKALTTTGNDGAEIPIEERRTAAMLAVKMLANRSLFTVNDRAQFESLVEENKEFKEAALKAVKTRVLSRKRAADILRGSGQTSYSFSGRWGGRPPER